jgi:hypothetical protein
MRRHPANPIITPSDYPGVREVFNPSPVEHNGKTILLLSMIFKQNSCGGETRVAESDDGKQVGTVNYDDVPKGGSVAKQLALPGGIVTAGVHKIKVYADTNKVVDEINENNNYLEKSFSIAK